MQRKPLLQPGYKAAITFLSTGEFVGEESHASVPGLTLATATAIKLGFPFCFPGGDSIPQVVAAAIFFCISSGAKEPDARPCATDSSKLKTPEFHSIHKQPVFFS